MAGLGRALAFLIAFATAPFRDRAEAETVTLAQSAARKDFELRISSSCGDLRRLTDNLDGDSERRLELSVLGALTMVRFDGTLAYLAVCEAPDPQVLCIAYGTDGLTIGDMVVLNGGLGGYARPDPDHILLDPCLPSRPQQ